MTDHFYVTLPSNSSTIYFPDNKTSHFKTQLFKRISLQGLWEVGIAEIHYPYTFSTISDKDFWLGYEIDLATLPVAIEGEDADEREEEEEGDGESEYETGGSGSEISNDGGVGRGTIHFPGGAYSTIESLLSVMIKNRDFGRLADISTFQARIQLKLKPGVIRLILSTALQRIFNLVGIDVKSFTEGVNATNIDACIPTQMYIYSDLIEPQYVGDVLAPLLRIVNIDNTQYVTGNHIVNVFTHPHYVPLMGREFQQIEIDIRDDLGYYIPFTHGTLNVKLHFRKIKEN